MRDGFRCVVTNVYDYHIAMVNEELKEIIKSAGAPPAVTHCAHIFSESPNANITSDSDKVRFLLKLEVFLSLIISNIGEICCVSLGRS